MDDGLATDEVEIEIGYSPLKVGLGLAGVVAVVTLLVVAFGGNSSIESVEEVESDDTAQSPVETLAATTQEQMAIDQSDGIALEVVGDELWVLGSGLGNPEKSEPFSIYVTGPEGELLRTIDVGRHFNEMGQSDSFVWLLADGSTQELVERAPELLQISKETGEIVRMRWGHIFGEVTSAAFSDTGFLASSVDSATRFWDTTGGSISSSPDIRNGGEQLLVDSGVTYMEISSWLYRFDEYGGQGFANASYEFRTVDMVFSGEALWILDESGTISIVGPDLERTPKGRCIGATHLAATPINNGVVASAGFDHCLIDLDTSSHTTLEPGPWPVADTAYFADQLWLATAYVSDRIAVPTEKLATEPAPAQIGAEQTSSNLAMYYDRSDGIDIEVVGGELWILGGGSEAAGNDAEYKIYVTDPSGRLMRTIDVGRPFTAMTQSDSYVWLISYGANFDPPQENGELVRISKRSGVIERAPQNFTPRPVVAFTDEGFFWESGAGGGVQLDFWEMFPGVATRVTALPERYLSFDSPVIASIAVGQDSIFLGMKDGWILEVARNGESVDEIRSLGENIPVVDLLLGDDKVLWALQADGSITALDNDLDEIGAWGCPNAVGLVEVPEGYGLATGGFGHCIVEIEEPGEVSVVLSTFFQPPASAFYFGQLWYANSYLDTRLTDRLDYQFTYWFEQFLPDSEPAETTHQQMNLDRSDGIALEVVGDELWVLGGGSAETENSGPFNIYVTGPDGELLRTIDVDHRYDGMVQSDSYVWLIGRNASSDPAAQLSRISKSSESVEYFAMTVIPGSTYLFDDEGVWLGSGNTELGVGISSPLLRWDSATPDELEAVELPEALANSSHPVITSMGLLDDELYLGTIGGLIFRVGNESTPSTGLQVTSTTSPVVDMIVAGDAIWYLQQDGVLTAIGENQEIIQQVRCGRVRWLDVTPESGLIAFDVSEACESLVDGPLSVNWVFPDEPFSYDTAYFAGNLWRGTRYSATENAVPLPDRVRE